MVLLPLLLESFNKALTKYFFINGSSKYTLISLSFVCGKTFTVDFLFLSLHTLTKASNPKGDFVPYPLIFLLTLPSITTLSY